MIGTLFDDLEPEKKRKIGNSEIDYKKVTTILTATSGFMKDYDYSLNPYSGCTFGCTYCYAAFFTRDKEKMDNWGKWTEVKENSLYLLMKYRKKSLNGKTIYLSSVTDPYQPIEKDLELTRRLLEELVTYHPYVRLVVQTRSALVTRDIDILSKFKFVQVNMTVTTDSEEVRRVFEPYCTSNKKRLEAIQIVQNSNIPSCVTMTPLLPIEDAEEFASNLLKTGVEKFVIQPFHKEKGKFIAGTRKEAIQLIEKLEWNDDKYLEVLNVLKRRLPNLGIGQSGFAPI
jgi:DNA repair photolyase